MKRSTLLIAALMLVSGAASAIPSRVNFVHLAPFDPDLEATTVSAWAGSQAIDENLRYGEASRYVEISAAGTTDRAVVVRSPAESNMTAVADAFPLAPGHSYTVAAIGDGANFPLELLMLADEPPRAANGLARVRIVHAAPFAANLDQTALTVRNRAGEVVAGLGELRYRANSGFLSLLPGTYQLEFANPNAAGTRLRPRPLSVNSGDVLTLFVTGDAANQSLGLLMIDRDGISTVLGEPLPAMSAFGAVGGWLSYLALAAVLACFIGVKLHRRSEPSTERPRHRSISVRHV